MGSKCGGRDRWGLATVCCARRRPIEQRTCRRWTAAGGLCSLQMRGDVPIPDSRIILAAYKRWGRECPAKLLGVFAFAVWDRQERTLTLARDHFGIRPLSYVSTA